MTISEGSGVMWRELLPRALHTLGLVLAATTGATCTGLGLALLTAPLGRRVNQALSVIGIAFAAMPVTGLGWLCIAALVNELKLPIESLIPYTPPPDRDATTLMLGRVLWSWLVPMWVIALPLASAWFAEISVALATARTLRNSIAVRARGLRGQVLSVHVLGTAWSRVQNRWLHLTIGALAWTLWVEDLFGLPGWGGFVARSLRAAQIADIAAALYAMAFIVAMLAVPSWVIRRLRRAGDISDQVIAEVVQSPPRSFASSITVLSVLTLALIAMACLQPAPPAWITQWLLPWLSSLLPSSWQSPAHDLALPALIDLHQAGAAAAWAALTTITLGNALAFLKQWRPLAVLEWVDVFAAGPMLVYFVVFGSPMAAGCALGLATACRWRDLCLALEASGYAQMAKVNGVPTWRCWLRHVGQPLLQSLAAWTLRHAATAMLWFVLLGHLRSGKTGLGERLAAARNTVLTDPATALWPTLVTAVVILALRALAGVVRADEEDSSLNFAEPRL
jgi:ABC-type dipeptide/oligopeptide/nickel transport system permease component